MDTCSRISTAELHRTARRELLLRGGGLPLTTLVHEAYLGMSVLVVHVLGR